MVKEKEPAAPERRRSGFFRRLRHGFYAAVLVFILLCAAFLLGQLYHPAGRGGLVREAEPVINSQLLLEYLRNVQDLVTVEYHYMKSNTYTNSMEFQGWSIPFTSKKFSVVYSGVIKSGVDMGRIRIRVNPEEKRVEVTLPEARIVSHEIPEENILVINESSSPFNPLTIDNYNDFTRAQKDAVEKDAIENEGLLDNARERAIEAVESLLSAMPGMEEYTLQVH